MHNILLKMFLFLFLFFSMLLPCSFCRLKELFQVKNGLTTSLLFSFFGKCQKIWVGRTTLNGEKKRMALWPLKTIHVIYVLSGEYTLSQFFLTFDMDKFGKLCQHHWKECLKISKTTKFESDLLKTIQTSVNFCNLTELYLCSLKTYHFQIWQFS